MSDALKLALTITAADMFSGVLRRFRDRITGTGAAAKQVQKDFDRMLTHFNRGVKALAIDRYLVNKIRPGVKAAADLQGAMLDVKQLLWQSGQGAGVLNKNLEAMRRNAVQVSAKLPNSATDLANIEANLLQGGVSMKAILGKHGAAFATAALSAVGHMDPAMVSEDLAKIGHAFQFKNKQYGTAANDLAKVSTASAADLGELLYNLRRSAPAAHLLNMPLKDTAVALGAVSSLGEEAGSDLNRFLMGLAGASRRGKKARRILHVDFFDKKGNFVGLEEALNRLRKGMARFNPKQQMKLMQRVFGTEGFYAGRLLMQTGNKSYEDILKRSQAAADLEQRMRIWGEGFNASVEMLGGTTKTTLATLFNPMLKPLREVVDLSNEVVSNIGLVADKHKVLAKAFSYGSLGLATGVGVYGIGQLLKGGIAGIKVWKGLKGLGGTAAGIAEGKAVQATTGVTPVFVTNWPNGGISGFTGGGTLDKDVEKAVPLAGLLGVGAATGAGIIVGGSLLSKVSRAHGWSSRTIQHDSNAYRVMGIGSSIDRSVARRAMMLESNHRASKPMKADVTVRVKGSPEFKLAVEKAKTDNKNLHLTTETEVGARSGGIF